MYSVSFFLRIYFYSVKTLIFVLGVFWGTLVFTKQLNKDIFGLPMKKLIIFHQYFQRFHSQETTFVIAQNFAQLYHKLPNDTNYFCTFGNEQFPISYDPWAKIWAIYALQTYFFQNNWNFLLFTHFYHFLALRCDPLHEHYFHFTVISTSWGWAGPSSAQAGIGLYFNFL